ncbi:hypothetical protein J0X19_21345 [Hymenobacter sp. BT186]|uniref:Uncharacterized protein n=1 Tax=Hymenobacter telluris TaxID=2816474 RepID=A0A939JCT2_9BACT|nr:hypothetical protein [Hymenobacter telluris]MBO0360521.1 hypothetical protein [Hymenobacter telluris]MBW3376548.1 hypothetical protein [Hymenobacter norwichensis]
MLLPLAPFPARFRPTVLRSALVPLVTLSLLLGSCRGKGDEAADVHQPGVLLNK